MIFKVSHSCKNCSYLKEKILEKEYITLKVYKFYEDFETLFLNNVFLNIIHYVRNAIMKL